MGGIPQHSTIQVAGCPRSRPPRRKTWDTTNLNPPTPHGAVYSTSDHDSHLRNSLCRSIRSVLRQLPQRLPKPLARGREYSPPPLPLPPLHPHALLVGKHPANKLASPPRPLPRVPCLDRLALSAGGAGCGRVVVGRYVANSIRGHESWIETAAGCQSCEWTAMVK